MLPLKSQDWPHFLRELKRLEYRPVAVTMENVPDGFYRFRIDLSEWQLSFGDNVPLIYIRASEADETSDEEISGVVKDLRRSGTLTGDFFLVIDRQAPELKREFRSEIGAKTIVLDAGDLDDIASSSSSSFTHAFRGKLTAHYDILDLAPYQIGGRLPRIFDRRVELNRILRHENASFAVTGIRRVGKTCLLIEVRRRMIAANRELPAPLFFDCMTFKQPHDFIRAVVREIDPRQYIRRQHVAGWSDFDEVKFLRFASGQRGGPVTIFLDEFDQILELPSSDTLNLIRASMNNGSCRYVLAGFQKLMAEMTNIKSPLYIFFEVIRVHPFNYEDVRNMLALPLESLGVRFHDLESIAHQLYEDTRGLPPVVQFYCAQLATIVSNRPDRTLNPEDVRKIHAAPVLKSLVLDTFRDSISKPDQLLTYVLLERYGTGKHFYTEEEMHQAMKDRGYAIELNELDRACDRLELAGLFTREGAHLRFTMPVFATLMAEDFDVRFRIETLQSELAT